MSNRRGNSDRFYFLASLVVQLVKNEPTGFNLWVGKIPWRRERLPTPLYWPREVHGLYSSRGHKESDTTEQLSLGFPDDSAGKESACNTGDLGSIPGLGKSPGEGKGYPLQYSGLENSMDYIVHGVAKGQT